MLLLHNALFLVYTYRMLINTLRGHGVFVSVRMGNMNMWQSHALLLPNWIEPISFISKRKNLLSYKSQ